MKITEITATPEYDPQKLINIIEQNCGPYLAEIGGMANALLHRPLYRGGENAFPAASPIIRIPVRQDRRPKSTGIGDHERADEWFKVHSRFNIPYRSASLFCSGSIDTAAAYARYYPNGKGTSIIVLPIGEYHYCWSPNVIDMFMDYRENSYEYGDGSTIVDFLDAADYEEDARLFKAINSHCEIMLHCKEALLIKPSYITGNVRLQRLVQE